MTDTVTLKPAPDRLVRKEDGEQLATTGERLVLNSYWRRRLDDLDVTVVKNRSDAK